METKTENNVINIGMNESEEQPVIVEGNKVDLPKLELPYGEKLCISREELEELYGRYYTMISDLKEGGAFASPELKSYMESVFTKKFQDELEDLHRKNYLKYKTEELDQIALNNVLTPCTWRNWWWIFKEHRNRAQMLLDERVRREAIIELKKREEELPELPDDDEGEEEERLPFTVALAELEEVLPRMRRKRLGSVYALLEQLRYAYDDKAGECKRLASELEIAHNAAQEAEERARAAEETLEEFLKDSTPTPDETGNVEEKPAEEPKQPEEAERTEVEPEAEDGEQSETKETEEVESEPADEEEDESLSYDGLDEADEQE